MAAVEGPGGFAVANYEDTGGGHCGFECFSCVRDGGRSSSWRVVMLDRLCTAERQGGLVSVVGDGWGVGRGVE